MDEALVRRVADAVWAQLSEKPRALCIGTLPQGQWDFVPVKNPPYDMVVLASLSPAELLQMPSDPVCRCLLEGKPVYLRQEGLEYRKYPHSGAKTLVSQLQAKERQLRNLGVTLLHNRQENRLLTAREVQRIKQEGKPLPRGARLTPLARDIWEGKV